MRSRLETAGNPCPANVPKQRRRAPGWIAQAIAVAWATLTSAATLTLTTDTTIPADDLTYDGQDIVVSGCTLTVDGAHSFNSLNVTAGGVVTHSPATPSQDYSLRLTLADALRIDATSSIDVSGRGYVPNHTLGNTTIGAATSYSGGSYGGIGAVRGGATNPAYGDFRDPHYPGSGGGGEGGWPAGSGGGLVRLVAASASVDGAILAQGGTGAGGGGGSGGGILLDVGELAVTGTIAADGGADTWPEGSGGGGRVAVRYASLASPITGAIRALPGTGPHRAAAGTVYVQEKGGQDELRIDNRGGISGQWTPLGSRADTALDVGSLFVFGEGTVAAPAINMPIRTRVVRLEQGGVLTHQASTAFETYGLTITASEQLTVDGVSRIDVGNRGYLAGHTAGNTTAGAATVYAGGSHGGCGGQRTGATNPTYGDFRDPLYPGSGGGGENGWPAGSGGGLVRIVAGTASVSGTICANGGEGAGGGGGSGGGILLNVTTLLGSGTIAADGGTDTRQEGAGGGGRVAIRCGSSLSFDLNRVTALGGGGPGAGAPGTVYLETGDAPDELRIDSHGAEAGAWTPLGLPEDTAFVVERLVISGAGVIAKPEHALPIQATALILSEGAVLSHKPASTTQAYPLILDVADTLLIDADSTIDVSGTGYPPTRTAGNPGTAVSTGYSGGSYGGRGFSLAGRSGSTYGDPRNPIEWGSGGGGGDGWLAGSGGGRVQISAATATLEGAILATGDGGSGGGGGSGGSIRMNVGVLRGNGRIAANGAVGRRGAGGGGGGRIAVYTWLRREFAPAQISADPGTGEAGPGEPGTVHLADTPHIAWEAGDERLHGVETLRWATLGVNPALNATMSLILSGPGGTLPIATGLAAQAAFAWNTAGVPDGQYLLTATLRDAAGRDIVYTAYQVLVNNSVTWHAGLLDADQIWTTGTVHVVEQSLIIAAGVTLTIQPGAIVKFVDRAGIVIAAGGVLNALGTAAAPIILTSLTDDTAGGDTTLDGAASRPQPGAWPGITRLGDGQYNRTDFTDLRYAAEAHSGVLVANEVWLGTSTHLVTGAVVVPSGFTLTIRPGAVVKFGAGLHLAAETGGALVALGTVAQPITFTSTKDDSVGGDSASDGLLATPGSGDWGGLQARGGSVVLDHVAVRYAGGSASGEWEDTVGAILTQNDGTVALTNSTIVDALFEGIHALGSGLVTVSNSVVLRCDRAVTADGNGSVRMNHCTLEDNRIGIWGHWGEVEMTNSILSNSIEAALRGPALPITLRYCNIWSTTGTNYYSLPDQTGTLGNLSVDPRYRDAARGDYRLDYGSPAIDAADGAASPATDLTGATRYDDPRLPNTGVPTAGGAYADLGAYEFVESAPSDLDLVVGAVVGPTTALAGEHAALQWIVTNIGAGTVTGPWRDSVYVVSNPLSPSPTAVLAGDVLVGIGVRLGPGESCTATGTVRVPGAALGETYWQVRTNSRHDVFEGTNTANNTGTAAVPTTLDVPEFTLGTAGVTGRFAAAGDTHWFRLAAATAATGVLVRLDLAGNGVTEMYIRYGEPSSPDNWDLAEAGNLQADQAIQLPRSGDGYYYITIVGSTLTAPDQAFTLTAQPVALAITSIAPTAVGNSGRATLQIDGVELLTDSTATLIAPNGTVLPSVDGYWWSPTRRFATFDLTGAATGAYTVQVTRGDGSFARLDGALFVAVGAGAQVWTRLEAPDHVRADRRFSVVLEYGNAGDADAPAPPATIQVDSCQSWTRPDGTTSPSPGYQVLLTSPDGPPGILRPGQRASFSFSVTALTVDPEISVWLSLPAQDESPEQMIRNSGGDPAAAPWNAVRADLATRFGSTHESYVQALAALATDYSQRSFASHDQQRDVADLQNYAVLSALLRPGGRSAAATATNTRAATREPYVPDLFDTRYNNDGFRLPDGRWIPPGFPPRLPTAEELERYAGESNLLWNACRTWFYQSEFDEWVTQWRHGSLVTGRDDWQAAVGSRISTEAMNYLLNSDSYGDQTTDAWERLETYLINADVPYGTTTIRFVPPDPALGEAILGYSANPILGRERQVTWNFGGGNLRWGKDASGAVVGFDVEVTRTRNSDADRAGDYVEWKALNVPFRWEDKFTIDEHCVNPQAHFADGRAAYRGDRTSVYQYHYLLQTFGEAKPFNWIINMVLPERRGKTRMAGVKANAGGDITVMLSEGATHVPVLLSGTAKYFYSVAHPSRPPFVWSGAPDPADEPAPIVTLSAGTYTFTLTVHARGTRPPNPDFHDSDQVQVTVLPWSGTRTSRRPRVVASHDPNDKSGPAGSAGFLVADALMPYTVQFENDARASAPAQDVLITDPLSANLDMATWQLAQFGFGGHQFDIPAGLASYQTTVDLRPEANLLVTFEARLNPITGLATWTFRSLDPETLEAPADPFLGFLPPNDATHRGEGFVSYTVRPRSGLPSGSEIRNQARIVFDLNPPLDTGETVNTIDITPPSSRVDALPTESAWDIPVTGSGNDAHAGVASYAIYVQDNGGPWQAWTTTTTGTATYTGLTDHTYGFYCIATDHAGNVEAKPPSAEATTTVTLNRTITLTADPTSDGSVDGGGRHDVNSVVTVTATAAPGHRFVNWTEAGSQVSTAASYSFTVAGNRSLTAHFAIGSHTVTFTANTHGTLAGLTAQTVLPGASTTPVQAVPDVGWVFDRWSDGSQQNPRIVTTVTADQALFASFRAAGNVPADGDFRAAVALTDVRRRGIWDLTGVYATTLAGAPLTLHLIHDTRGRLTGTSTCVLAAKGGKPTVTVTMPIRGNVSGSTGSIGVGISFRGTDASGDASVTATYSLTLQPATRQLEGTVAGSLRVGGVTIPAGAAVRLDIPTPMDGTWALDLQHLTRSGQTLAGTAILILSNGVELRFEAKGKAMAGGATLRLVGQPDDPQSRSLRIRTTVETQEGGWAQLSSLSATGYGQFLAW